MDGIQPDKGISSLFKLQSSILKSGGILELVRQSAIQSRQSGSTLTSMMANRAIKGSSRDAALVDLVYRGLGKGNNVDLTA